MIKRQRIDLSEERRVLSFMITSTPFLRDLKDIADPRLFQSTYSQTIARWIWEFYDYAQQAPGRAIEEIYVKKRSDVNGEDETELISEFLQNLSDDWEKYQVHNVKYNVKNAIDFFKLRSLDRLKSRVEDALAAKDAAAGERIVAEYRKVDRPRGKGISILNDSQSIIHAFSKEEDALFSFAGELGKAIGVFNRGDFIAFLGAMKKGKTWWLLHTAIRAMQLGFRVFFASLEMSENRMLRRTWQMLTGQPLQNGTYNEPAFEEDEDEGTIEIVQKKKDYKGIDPTEVPSKQKLYKKYFRSGDMRMVVYPSGGASLLNLNNDLANFEYYDMFIPDVIIIDYGDIVQAVDSRMDYRHQIDSIWKGMRGMAQERNALVVTATQTGRKGLDHDVTGSDTAEDVRKLAHVTQLISINANEKERDEGLYRLKTEVVREGKFISQPTVVLHNLDIGRPYLDSLPADKINLKRFSN